MKLTPKQKAFADEYLICGNATETARKAGYNPKSASRNKKIYGGKKITEGEAEEHATVREVKSYYEKMEGRRK